MTATIETPILDIPTAPNNTPQLGRKYTVEEFFALPDDGHKYELVDGALVEKDRMVDGMPGPSARHANVMLNLAYYFKAYLLTNPLGIGFTDGAFTLRIGERTFVRRPDVGFLAQARAAGIDFNTGIDGAPDLAVEIVSPTDVRYEVTDKIHEYLEAGTKLVWVIDPSLRVALACRQGQERVQLVNRDEELDGEDVIEGFKLRVGLLFE